MFSPIAGIRQTAVFRLFSLLITFVLITGLVMPPAQAAMLSGLLPQPGQILALSASYRPAILRGITINPDNPFLFDFLLQRGDTRLQGAELKTESEKLIKYFLTALTVPEDQGWVNLSPYEKDKIIGDSLSATQMGRTMLEQDYTLKQLSASLTYPETPLGQTFWTRVQDMAFKQFGTRDIPIDNFNKVWIVPERAVVTEEGATAFVVDWHLKVMMEADYQALKNDQAAAGALTGAADDPQAAAGQELSARFVREIVIPQLEKEVNEGTHFAPIRQVFLSVILATWFKQRLRESLLGKIYVDQGKTAGVDTEDPAIKELIYAQYLAAFKQGVYNLVREDYDTDAQTMIPRKYFSGGVKITSLSTPLKIVPVEGIASSAIQHPGRSDDYTMVTVLTEESQPAAAAGIAAPSSPVVVPVTTTSLPGVGAESGTTKNVKFNGRSFPAGEFAIALHNMIDAVKMVHVNPIDEPGKVRWMISLFSYKEGGPAVPAVVSALGELLAEHHAALGLGLVTGKSLEDASLLHVGLEIKSRAVVLPGFWLWFLKNDDVLWFLRRLQYVMHKQLKDLSNIDSSATLDLLSASELEHPGYHLDIEWRSSESVLVRMWAPDVDATIFRFGEMGLPELEAARSMMREALDPSDPGNIRRFANKFEAIGASLSVGMGETILINGHEISRRAAARVAWQMQKDMDLLVGADGVRDKNRLVLGLVQPEGKENNWTEEELSIADHLLDEWAHDLGLERVTVSQGLDQPSSAQNKDARLFFGLGVKQTGLDRIAAALDKRTQLRLQQAQDKIGTDLEKLLNPGADALSSPIQRETTDTADEILINGKRFFVLDALAAIRELRAAARIVKVTPDEGQGPATLISLTPTQPSAALANPEVVEAIMGQLAQDTELERGSGVESNSTQRIYNRTRQSGLRLPEFSPRDEAVVRHRVSQQSLGQTRKALDALAAQAQQAVIATINRGWQAPVKEFSDYLILTGPTSEMTHPAAPLLVVMQAPEISADPDQPAEPKFRQGFMRPEEIVAAFRLLRDAAAATQVGPTRDRFKNKFEDVMHSLAGVDVESPDIEINGQSFPARSVFRVLSQLERDAELSQDGIPPQLDKYSVAVGLVHPVSFQNHWTREELRIADQLLTKWSQDLGMDRVSFRQELTSRGRAPEVWGLGAAPTLPSDPSAPAVARLIFMDKIDDKIGEILNQFHRSQSSPVLGDAEEQAAPMDVITIGGQSFSAVEALPVIERMRKAARVVEVKLSTDGKKRGQMISLDSTDEGISSNHDLVTALIKDLGQGLDLDPVMDGLEAKDPRSNFTTVHSGLAVPKWSLVNMISSRSNPNYVLDLTRWGLQGWVDAAKRVIINTLKQGWSSQEPQTTGYEIKTGIPFLYDFSPVYVVMTGPVMAWEALPYAESRRMWPGEVVRAFQMLKAAADGSVPVEEGSRFANKFADIRASLVVDPSAVFEISGQAYNARAVFRVLSQMRRDLLPVTGIQIGTEQPSALLGLVRPFSTVNYWTEQELAIAGALLTMWASKHGLQVSQVVHVKSADPLPDAGTRLVWGLAGAETDPANFQQIQDSMEGEIASLAEKLKTLPGQSSPVAATGDSAVAESGMIQQQPAGQAGVDRSGMEEIHWVIDQMKRDLQVVKLPVTDSAGIEKEYSAIGLRRPFGPEPDWTPGRLVRAWKYMDKWEEEFGLRLAPVPQYHAGPSDKILLSERWIWGLIGDKNRLPAVMEEITQRLTSYAKKLDTFLASEEGAKIDADLAALMKSFDDSFPSVKVGSSPIAAGEPQLTDARDQVIKYVRQVEEIIADPRAGGYLDKVAAVKRQAAEELTGAAWGAFNKISMGLFWWRMMLSQIESPGSTKGLGTVEVIVDRFTAIRAAFSAEERLLTGLADERESLFEKWQDRMDMLTSELAGLAEERAEQAKVIGEHVISFQQELARARAAQSAASSSPMGATGAAAVDPGASLQWQELFSDLIEESWGMLSKTEGRFASLQNVNAHAIRGVDLAMTGAFRRVTEGLVVGIRMRRNVIADVVPDPGSIKNDFVNIYDSFLAEQRFIQDPTLRQLSLAKWAELMSQLDEAADNLPSEQSLAAQAIREQIAAFQAELDRARNVTEPQTLAEAIIVDQQQPAFLPESQPLSSPAAPGGIDLDPRNMDLQIRRDAHGVPLPLPMQDLEQIHIDGLYPVILNIAPANLQGLPFLLGLLADQDPPLLAREVTGQEG